MKNLSTHPQKERVVLVYNQDLEWAGMAYFNQENLRWKWVFGPSSFNLNEYDPEEDCNTSGWVWLPIPDPREE